MAESLFTTQTPAFTNEFDGHPYTLGTVIVPAVAGQVTGGRWRFPTTLPSGSVDFVLYDENTQAELARTTFASPTAGAWNTVALSTPVSVTAGQRLVAAVYTPDRYVSTSGLFNTSGITNGNLSAPATGSDPIGNGRFNDPNDAYPSSTFGGNGYFADVQFTASGGGGTTHSATASGASTSTGSAAVTVRLAAAAAGASTSAGAAAVTLRLAATAPGASTSTGSAAATIVPPGPVTWQAAASGASTSTGAAAVTLKMAATAIGSSTSTGSAAITMRLSAAASGASTSSGSANPGRLLSALAAGASMSAGAALATLLGPTTGGTMCHATRTAARAGHANRAAASAAASTRTMARASGARRSGPTTTGR